MTFEPGLIHAPVTPFDPRGRIDCDALGRLLDFHIANGADAIALPMHGGESVSIPDAEKRDLFRFAVAHCRGRVPVLAHATHAGTELAASLAREAEAAGAAAIIVSTPYYWTPPARMLVEHFATVAGATRLPTYVHNAPEEMSGAKVNTELMLQLVERADTVSGVIDSGLDWQFMIELLTHVRPIRPDFQLIAGIDYMVSAGAIGAVGLVSAAAGIAPRLVRNVFDHCRSDRLFEARAAQEQLAALLMGLGGLGPAGLKAVQRAMQRDCGEVRPPLEPLSPAARVALEQALAAVSALKEEPRGW